jgi:hypothetical protein
MRTSATARSRTPEAHVGGVASLVGSTGGIISGLSKPSQNRWLEPPWRLRHARTTRTLRARGTCASSKRSRWNGHRKASAWGPPSCLSARRVIASIKLLRPTAGNPFSFATAPDYSRASLPRLRLRRRVERGRRPIQGVPWSIARRAQQAEDESMDRQWPRVARVSPLPDG